MAATASDTATMKVSNTLSSVQGTRHQQVKYKDEHANGQHHLG